MTSEDTRVSELSPRRVIGFACNQSFVFYLFYMGINQSISFGAFSLERADLLAALFFIAAGLFVMGRLDAVQRQMAFSRPLLYVYAVLIAAGSLVPSFFDVTPIWIVLEGALVGVPVAYLLAAWGRTFGQVPSDTSVIEVFAGSLVGAFVCLAFSFVASSELAFLAFRILPIASVVNLEVPTVPEHHSLAFSSEVQNDALTISRKVLAGTLLFGAAAGCVETFGTNPGDPAFANYGVSMVVFCAFLIGSISLLISDGFGKGAALNKSYRLAVFIMMVGVMSASLPAVEQSILQGEAVVMAGYLGLESVLISLFLVLAKITESDTDIAFSRGFSALFLGGLAGVILSNVANTMSPDSTTPFAVIVVSGVLVLLSYVFLFTERDFDALSQIVAETDVFELARAEIVERFGLSSREAEILVYALHGRTSNRIAEELTIAKSTVDSHLRRIYAKTGVHSKQELLDLFENVRSKITG